MRGEQEYRYRVVDVFTDRPLEGNALAGLKDPDLLIRTSGEMRISNFLLWQIAYSELYVTDTLWPDFTRTELLEAIFDYQNRERRFGGSQSTGRGRVDGRRVG